MLTTRLVIFHVASVLAVMLAASACDSGSNGDRVTDNSAPSRLETFNPNVLNNIVQDPDNPERDGIYPEFVLNLEEARPEDRNISRVTAHWPDGRQTALEEDFRPGAGILRWVKHDLDRFGTKAPSGTYRFEVELASAEIIEVDRQFEQRILGRPKNVSLTRSGDDLAVSWTAPNAPHLYGMEILPNDPEQNEPVVPGPQATSADAGEQVSYTFQSPALTSGASYRLALIFSGQSSLRSHHVPFVWF